MVHLLCTTPSVRECIWSIGHHSFLFSESLVLSRCPLVFSGSLEAAIQAKSRYFASVRVFSRELAPPSFQSCTSSTRSFNFHSFVPYKCLFYWFSRLLSVFWLRCEAHPFCQTSQKAKISFLLN